MYWVSYALTPSPAPTPVPIPTPIVNVSVSIPTPPPTGVSQLLLTGLPGALLTAVVALGLAFYVGGRERRARLEERRTTVGTALLDKIAALHLAIESGDLDGISEGVGEFVVWGPRVVGMYGNTREHRRFAVWLQAEVEALMPKLATVRNDSDQLNGLPRKKKDEIGADLAVLQGSVIRWLMVPRRKWQPDLQARRLLEAQRTQKTAMPPKAQAAP